MINGQMQDGCSEAKTHLYADVWWAPYIIQMRESDE